MAKIEQFEDLEVWKHARVLAQVVFKLTLNSSFAKDFSLKDQIRRSSGSIMDNIAEGFDRNGNKEFIHFLSISKGSLAEVKSQLTRALDFNYISDTEFRSSYDIATSIGKQLGGLIKYLKSSEMKGSKFLEPDSEYMSNFQKGSFSNHKSRTYN